MTGSLLYDLKPTDLISPQYRVMQEQLHADPRGYGHRGHKWASVVAGLVARYQASSLLDYGCGQGALVRDLRPMLRSSVRIEEYDPAIRTKAHWPLFADLVVCTDVLEHVEPEKLSTVLRHLHVLTRKAIWLVVALCDTAKVLADGRSAHLILQPGLWWSEQIQAAGFRVLPAPDDARKKPEKEWTAVCEPCAN